MYRLWAGAGPGLQDRSGYFRAQCFYAGWDSQYYLPAYCAGDRLTSVLPGIQSLGAAGIQDFQAGTGMGWSCQWAASGRWRVCMDGAGDDVYGEDHFSQGDDGAGAVVIGV